jgi:hypothetical protein
MKLKLAVAMLLLVKTTNLHAKNTLLQDLNLDILPISAEKRKITSEIDEVLEKHSGLELIQKFKSLQSKYKNKFALEYYDGPNTHPSHVGVHIIFRERDRSYGIRVIHTENSDPIFVNYFKNL